MSKLFVHEEHPLEIACYKFAELISPFFKTLNFTPNGLTTVSNVGGAAALYSLYHKQYFWIFIVGLAVKYLFDCADGYYARRYKMTSEFGDLYDHISDWVFYGALALVVFSRYEFQEWAYRYRGYLIAGLLLLIFFLCIHMGCQERLYAKRSGKNSTVTLTMFQKACPKPDEYIHFTRWIGSPVILPCIVAVTIMFILE